MATQWCFYSRYMLDIMRGQSGWEGFQLSAHGREHAFDKDAAGNEDLLPTRMSVINEVLE